MPKGYKNDYQSGLTHDRLLTLLSYDSQTGIFTWRDSIVRRAKRRGQRAGNPLSDYWEICVDRKQYKAHRLAWFYVHGVWPTGDLDHINRNKQDNRIANLREASRGQNNLNRSKENNHSSGRVGVCWTKSDQRWFAYITVNYKGIGLGSYKRLEDAIAARRAAELKYFGEHAA